MSMRVKQYRLVAIYHIVMIAGVVLCSMCVEQYSLVVDHLVNIGVILHTHTYCEGGGGGGQRG